jgi:hypothetical protein
MRKTTPTLYSLILMSYRPRLNENVDKLHKIIAIIQRSKTRICIMTFNKALKVHKANIDSTYDTTILFILRAKDPKSPFLMTQEGGKRRF